MANKKGPLLTALEEVRKNPTLAMQALAKRKRPAPADTDTGLVRLSLVRGGGLEPNQNGDYIRFSQAEELLAAERADKEELKKALADREWISNKHNEYRAKLKADNAALTARVKAFVEYEQEAEGVKELYLGQIEALEAKLAAANKALGDIKTIAWQREILPPASANKDVQRGTAIALSGRLGEIISKARAALEAKP